MDHAFSLFIYSIFLSCFDEYYLFSKYVTLFFKHPVYRTIIYFIYSQIHIRFLDIRKTLALVETERTGRYRVRHKEPFQPRFYFLYTREACCRHVDSRCLQRKLEFFARAASYREYARRGRTTMAVALRLRQRRAGWHSFPLPIVTLPNKTLQDCLLAPAATGTLDRCHLDLHKCVRREALEMLGRVSRFEGRRENSVNIARLE